MMEYKDIQVTSRNHITVITINRPEVRNAINPLTSLELTRAFDEFQADPDGWAAILTGSGEKAFSAGNDLKFDSVTPRIERKALWKQLKYGFGGLVFNYSLNKPVIAAVNGFSMGGGFELALACDVILAAEHAVFSFPEPKVGRVPGGGGVHRLVRQIPYHAAMDLLLSGRQLTAREAMHYGIVSRVVPADDLMTTAYEIADDIIAGSPLALRTIKEMACQGLEKTLQQANSTVFPLYEQFLSSDDFEEGPLAFTEKRKPVWKGI